MEKIMQTTDLVKRFEGHNALNKVNIEIQKGVITGLVGSNGAGKSTLIKTCLGFLTPTEGSSSIFGEDSMKIGATEKNLIGYVPQTVELFNWMKVKDFVKFALSFYDKPEYEKSVYLIEKWKIDTNKRISALSEGQKQKLAIIVAMTHNAELYIFDEPVASLDPLARRQFIDEILNENIESGKTVLFSTHIISDLERSAENLIVLSKGNIIYNGKLIEITDKFKKVSIGTDKTILETLEGEYDFIEYDESKNFVNCIIRNYNENFHKDKLSRFEYYLNDMSIEDIVIHLCKE
ncbi:MAG: ABC transporter ATP-binding protein [Candidatus Delongbacteria bacterium]|nr:ABC transporter ATP-binding protein [Candidatus Delongbacteria bacterium]MBN2835712.1 ABC transporter ATP-binding protein [Candidatus Delongbacteria bacterium]